MQPYLGFWNKSQFSAIFNLLVSFQWHTEAATTSACSFIKKETLAQVFPVNFVKLSRTPFLRNTSGRLLLDRQNTQLIRRIVKHFNKHSRLYTKKRKKHSVKCEFSDKREQNSRIVYYTEVIFLSLHFFVTHPFRSLINRKVVERWMEEKGKSVV